MLRHVLVPLDGSGFAEGALATGVALARRDGAVLSLLTVVPPPVPPVYLEGAAAVAADLYEQAAAAGAEYVASVKDRILAEAEDLAVHALTVRGGVVESIDRTAREVGADLIVMSSHGRGPFQRMWLGSVADGVLRQAPAAVLLIRPGEDGGSPAPTGFPTVLIPVDASSVAREIIPAAVAVAGSEARYRVLRIAVPSEGPREGRLPDPRDEFPDPDDERERAVELLGLAEASLRELGVTEVSSDLIDADHAAAEIIGHAGRTEVSLVAMSTHGEGGVARLLLGSTADKVTRGVHCPVLLHRVPGGTVES